jgi:hypothetical protein
MSSDDMACNKRDVDDEDDDNDGNVNVDTSGEEGVSSGRETCGMGGGGGG